MMMLRNPEISVDELHQHLQERGMALSRLTTSTIRAEFKEVLAFLECEGVIDVKAKKRRSHVLKNLAKPEKRTALPSVQDEELEPGLEPQIKVKKRRPFRKWNFNG